MRFCRILSCQNLEEQLLASPARCSLKTGSSQCVLRYSKGPTIIHQPRSGDILPIVRCGSLKRLLIWMILMRLAVCSSFKAFRTYQLPSCWSLEMTRIGNVTGSGSSKCYRRSTTTRSALSPVLNKLQEDPRKNKIAHTNDFTSSDDIVLSETNWFVRPHWVWQNFWHLFWYLFWRYFLKLPDIESDVTSDIWSDICP